MNVAAFGRTLLLIAFLAVVLAGINMAIRLATPPVSRVSPMAGKVLDFIA
jgi:hypothetical protein